MSRHLMARFRHLAAQPINWQRGVLIPETADLMSTDRKRGWTDPWKPKHVSTAFVPHGERMHALQVNKETSITDEPYLWSIHAYRGPDGVDPRQSFGWEHLDPGNHAEECSMCEAGPGEKCHPECWDQNSRTGGGMRNTLEDEQWQDGSRGELWGWQPDRDSAQRAAETAWAKYTGENGSGLGDYDINKLMRDEGF